MNFSRRSLENNNDAKRTLTNKITTLNPNAAEFVPSAIRSLYRNKSLDANRLDQKGASGEVVLDCSESNVSCNSDDEAHQYWRCQLPDDITPDFKVMGKVELPGPKQLSLSGLSLHDGTETSRFSGALIPGQTRFPIGIGSHNLNGNLGYPRSTSTEDQSYSASLTSILKSWDKKIIDGNQQLTSRMGGHHYDGNSSASFLDDLVGDQALKEEADINPLVFLTSQYPRFSAERLAEVYCANECNLNSTIEMLHQFELQMDGSFSQTSELFGTPRRSVPDFSSMPVEAQNGLSTCARDFQQTSSMHRSRGSNRSSQLLASSFDGHGKLHYGVKSRSFGAARAASVLPETEQVLANMYSGSREDVRDIAALRNACLEQASQAYLIGNNALSRELSEKGHLYNMQMKSALLKAGDTVNPQRSPSSPELYGHNRNGQERLIDLHNLHINEALLVLEHELGVLRSTARSSGQRYRIMIRVSSGVQAKGPQRLPMAIEQFLLAEGLHYTQPQPGLLHVAIY